MSITIVDNKVKGIPVADILGKVQTARVVDQKHQSQFKNGDILLTTSYIDTDEDWVVMNLSKNDYFYANKKNTTGDFLVEIVDIDLTIKVP